MRLLIIVGSTRPVRVGDQVAEVVAAVAREHDGVEVVVDDLATRALPWLDEPMPAAMASGNYVGQHTKDWAATVAAADALVLVSPQYNGGYPAPVKNAIDYLWDEWQGKPALVVTYGSTASDGGKHSQAQLTDVTTMIGWQLVSPGQQLVLPQTAYGADGRLTDPAETLAPFREQLEDKIAQLVANAS